MTMSDGCDPATDETLTASCGHRLSLERRLEKSGYLALRAIDCDCRGGVLCLRGSVPSHYLRQVAQAIAIEIEGILGVDNQLRVLPAREVRRSPEAGAPPSADRR